MWCDTQVPLHNGCLKCSTKEYELQYEREGVSKCMCLKWIQIVLLSKKVMDLDCTTRRESDMSKAMESFLPFQINKLSHLEVLDEEILYSRVFLLYGAESFILDVH